MKPIGYVSNARSEISNDYWGSIISEIELVEEIPEETLTGIDEFSSP
jgi:tRNA (Thr-GGU) A37 N-methylase